MPLNGDMNTGRAPSDLAQCDREPIAYLGMIQPFAALVAVSRDWRINHLSANAQEMLGLEHLELGRALSDVLPAELIHDIRTRISTAGGDDILTRHFGCDVSGNGRLFDISVHTTDRDVVIEFEPASTEVDRDLIGTVRTLIARLRGERDDTRMFRRAVMSLKALSGFDRVMLYRFNGDDSGTVIAESVDDRLEPYLGLRYPASDIPQPARVIMMRSPLRLVSDVRTLPVPVADRSDSPVLDLSLSISRGVSPVHLEYLENMGVRATMTAPIVRGGRLWGLFACHHSTPRYVDFGMRTAIELFAQLFTYELMERESAVEQKRLLEAQAFQQRLIAEANAGDLIGHFELFRDEIGRLIDFDGIAIAAGGQYRAEGAALGDRQFRRLAEKLAQVAPGAVFTSQALERDVPGLDTGDSAVAGVLSIPLSQPPADYVLLYRREVAQTVDWAGEPAKAVRQSEDGLRLSPRKSFALWQEIVRGQSETWSVEDTKVAEAIRATLLEVVMKLASEAAAERQKAADRQELLIAELNHRVRNILNLVSGLVKRNAGSAGSVAELESGLNDRIFALARAHDQLTATNWKQSSLQRLIQVEIDAYPRGSETAVTFSGEDALLTAEALSTMALVVHELVTNSVKYGALSSTEGRLVVETSIDDSGALKMAWRETGGPPVSRVSRRGFGTTIIERSIPYELGGEARVDLGPAGMTAEFEVPARFVTAAEPASDTTVELESESHQPVSDDGAAFPESFLVIEDNVIIALDSVGQLEHAGAMRVETASTVTGAMRRLDDFTPEAALVDINLGAETSLPVIERLTDLGVPLVLTTGYSASDLRLPEGVRAEVLSKPYPPEALIAAIGRAVAKRRRE